MGHSQERLAAQSEAIFISEMHKNLLTETEQVDLLTIYNISARIGYNVLELYSEGKNIIKEILNLHSNNIFEPTDFFKQSIELYYNSIIDNNKDLLADNGISLKKYRNIDLVNIINLIKEGVINIDIFKNDRFIELSKIFTIIDIKIIISLGLNIFEIEKYILAQGTNSFSLSNGYNYIRDLYIKNIFIEYKNRFNKIKLRKSDLKGHDLHTVIEIINLAKEGKNIFQIIDNKENMNGQIIKKIFFLYEKGISKKLLNKLLLQGDKYISELYFIYSK